MGINFIMKIDDIKKLQESLNVEPDGIIGNITRNAFADRLIEIALKDVGIFETSKNRGDGISKFWNATDYKDGYKYREPYCAAAVSYWIREMNVFDEETRPKTAGAFNFERWGEGIGVKVLKSPDHVKRGNLVIFNFSHIGIVTSDSDNQGRFATIEANTSTGEKGSQRDGGGVYRRTRKIDSVRSIIVLG